jgi:site-specific DNA-methyltransferase (cytosine-N4-specific)
MAGDSRQPDLFEPLLEAYGSAQEGQLANHELYARLSAALDVDEAFWAAKEPVGRSQELICIPKRRVRWLQQTMKELGLLERTADRGVWRVTARGQEQLARNRPRDLTIAQPGTVLLGFSTKLGIALWANARDAFTRISEPVHLCLTSPPYPLQRARAYGNPQEREFSDWICYQLEPVVRLLAKGGSVVLNIGQDLFMPGSPERSLYLERAVLDLQQRLGLSLMDRIPWVSPKPPGPTRWACVGHQQLVHAYEPCLWFTNDPVNCFADNRRVLRPHSEQHLRLLARGGERRKVSYGDGAHRIRPGSFGNASEGTLPRNVLHYPHDVREQARLRKAAAAAGLPAHGAMMPRALARFFIEFLTLPGHLVADLFAGMATTAAAAEETGRRWVTTERVAEYVAGSALRFAGADDFVQGFEIWPHDDGRDASDSHTYAPRG